MSMFFTQSWINFCRRRQQKTDKKKKTTAYNKNVCNQQKTKQTDTDLNQKSNDLKTMQRWS